MLVFGAQADGNLCVHVAAASVATVGPPVTFELEMSGLFSGLRHTGAAGVRHREDKGGGRGRDGDGALVATHLFYDFYSVNLTATGGGNNSTRVYTLRDVIAPGATAV